MKTATIELTTASGTMPAYEVTPDVDGPRGAILFFMDGLGWRPALFAMADRLGGAGYHVLLPDLFYRVGRGVTFPASVFSDPAKLAEVRKTIGHLTPELAMSDAEVCLSHLSSRTDVDPGRLGAVGYCMGGKNVLLAAAHFGDRLRAGASIHGGGLVTTDPSSPHLGAPRIRARMYFGVAKDDPSCTREHAATLEAALRDAGVRHRLEHYEARHGWAVPDTPVHDAAEAERHWRAIFELFSRELGPDADA